MPVEKNEFKAALKRGEQKIGLWLGLGEATTAELCAQAGFDWLLVDGEHGPNDLRSILDQLRALAAFDPPVVVRPPSDDRALMKQYLDIGVRNFLVPMIESGVQAKEVVRSVRYPPEGVRGIGAALARASLYNTVSDYLATASDEICVLLQVESRAGIAALDDILATEGVDGVFVGPSDLAADMGFPGKVGAPEVQETVLDALERIKASDKAAGILIGDAELTKKYQKMGVEFLAVGTDVGVFMNGLKALRQQF
ncbi:aldolase/citrate lyase family protein [Martelella radicis]|uniref:4-hydroxy-2-oxoheptanedioate aldolase n=1 Tax=Martelella radicis TaxID=1397476 RepID=A0A7W6KNR1_9HYPH|nr:HpcH/HpaI aldolase/citrate lyase family protein [Martelella radicis]MBB4123245.1 4-hydroxy-2-oxoheptanedioate aldolase [Martelella radicis]